MFPYTAWAVPGARDRPRLPPGGPYRPAVFPGLCTEVGVGAEGPSPQLRSNKMDKLDGSSCLPIKPCSPVNNLICHLRRHCSLKQTLLGPGWLWRATAHRAQPPSFFPSSGPGMPRPPPPSCSLPQPCRQCRQPSVHITFPPTHTCAHSSAAPYLLCGPRQTVLPL